MKHITCKNLVQYKRKFGQYSIPRIITLIYNNTLLYLNIQEYEWPITISLEHHFNPPTVVFFELVVKEYPHYFVHTHTHTKTLEHYTTSKRVELH